MCNRIYNSCVSWTPPALAAASGISSPYVSGTIAGAPTLPTCWLFCSIGCKLPPSPKTHGLTSKTSIVGEKMPRLPLDCAEVSHLAADCKCGKCDGMWRLSSFITKSHTESFLCCSLLFLEIPELLRITQTSRILHHDYNYMYLCVLLLAPSLSANCVISGDQSSKREWGAWQCLPLWALRQRGWGPQQTEQPGLSQKYQQVRQVVTLCDRHSKVNLRQTF